MHQKRTQIPFLLKSTIQAISINNSKSTTSQGSTAGYSHLLDYVGGGKKKFEQALNIVQKNTQEAMLPSRQIILTLYLSPRKILSQAGRAQQERFE